MNKRKSSKFKESQHIFCTGGLHQGQTATIVKANNQRLRVKFDNPSHDGMFVDIADATIVANNFNPMKDPDPRKVTNVTPTLAHSASIVASKPNYYAVAQGRRTGIYNTWNQCNEQVKGYSNAKFKKFINRHDAVNFVEFHNENKQIMKKDQAKIMNDKLQNNTNSNCETDELPLLLQQLAMTTATAIHQSCNNEYEIKHTQKCFYDEVKKYLHLSSKES